MPSSPPERSPQRDDEPDESRRERVNRELIELLQELRVAVPGVQFLFGFLLIVPFQQRVTQLTDFQRDVYFVALLATAVATGLLIAPSAQHRILFRKHDKEALLRRSNLSAIAGILLLAVAIALALLLVVDVLFTPTRAWFTAGVVAVLLIGWWFTTPLVMRARGGRDDDERS